VQIRPFNRNDMRRKWLGLINLAEREGFESRLNPSRAYTDFSRTSESILDFPIKTAIFL
jgi:hypothetical protein